MTDTTKTEALRLADMLEAAADNADMGRPKDKRSANRRAAAELRRLSFMEAERDQLRDAMKYRSEALNLMREAAEQFRSEREALRAALSAILKSPTGCQFCDYGKPRLSIRTGSPCEHDESCGFVLAHAAMGGKESQGGNGSGQNEEVQR